MCASRLERRAAQRESRERWRHGARLASAREGRSAFEDVVRGAGGTRRGPQADGRLRVRVGRRAALILVFVLELLRRAEAVPRALELHCKAARRRRVREARMGATCAGGVRALLSPAQLLTSLLLFGEQLRRVSDVLSHTARANIRVGIGINANYQLSLISYHYQPSHTGNNEYFDQMYSVNKVSRPVTIQ